MYRNLNNNTTHMSWASNVKTRLQSIGLYEAWVNQGLLFAITIGFNRNSLFLNDLPNI